MHTAFCFVDNFVWSSEQEIVSVPSVRNLCLVRTIRPTTNICQSLLKSRSCFNTLRGLCIWQSLDRISNWLDLIRHSILCHWNVFRSSFATDTLRRALNSNIVSNHLFPISFQLSVTSTPSLRYWLLCFQMFTVAPHFLFLVKLMTFFVSFIYFFSIFVDMCIISQIVRKSLQVP